MSRRARATMRGVLSALAGAICGVLVHYFLYLISLPLLPFIYVAF